MSTLLQDAATRAAAYLDGLAERRVACEPAAVRALDALDGELPAAPADPREVLELLDRWGSPATMATAGPRFFGFVIGGSLEQIALRWLIDLFGLPRDAGGAFVTGATVANFVALAAARHAVLARVGWSVEADGLFGAPPVTVVVSEEAHASLVKALGLVGFGRNRVVKVPVDGQGRMRADELPEVRVPAIVCTQVGNVNTGAIDPVGEVCARARQRRLGPRRRCVRSMGRRLAAACTAAARRGGRGLVGLRRAQMAQCPV